MRVGRDRNELNVSRDRAERDVADEVSFHLEQKARQLVAGGMSEDDARREARRRFGNVEEVEGMMNREQRLRSRAQWWDDVRRDIAHALRTLRRSRGFAGAATATLALGIGASTAILTVVNGVLLRPLPYPNADRTLLVWETGKSGTQAEGLDYPFSVENFVDARAQAELIDVMAAFRTWAYSIVDENGEAFRLAGARVSPGLFEALGVEPAVGRSFAPEDERPGAEPVVILGDALWRARFASDPQVVGTRITLNGESYTVIGVMPRGFTFPRGAELPSGLGFGARTELWSPLTLTDGDQAGRGTLNVAVLVLPRAGATSAAVDAELVRIMAGLEEQYPRFNTGLTARTAPLLEFAVASVRRPLYILLGAVGFLLVIACVNVSNLLLTRSAARRREWSVRGALGAGHGRLLRQILTESVVLTIVGGLLGVAVSAGTTGALLALLPTDLPRVDDVALDWRVLGVVAVIVLGAGVSLGALAASSAARGGAAEGLRVSTDDGGRFGRRVRRIMLVLQVAASVVLLVGASALGRTYHNLSRVDPGLAPEGVLTAEVSLPRISADVAAFGDQLPEFTAFFTELATRLGDQPGISSVGVISALPLSGLWESAGVRIEGAPPPEPGRAPSILFAGVSDDYFTTVGMPLLRGRAFGPLDADRRTAGIVITESMARRHWPEGDAIGGRVSAFFGRDIEVIGVVADVRHRAVDAEPEPMMFLPLSLYAGSSMRIVVATDGSPEAALPIVRSTLRSLDPGVPLTDVRTLRQVFDQSIGEQRFSAMLLAMFAAAALGLAVIGVHGVVSFGVASRSREIGLRVALGADRREVLLLVLVEGLTLSLVGIAIGLAGATAVGRGLSGMVYEVSPTDPGALVAVSVMLVMVALTASLLPARRALRVDPVAAMKDER
jgi:predicted permease